MELVHVELKEANDFVESLHRHHKRVQGHRFSLGAKQDGKLIGVAIVGRPVGGQHQSDWVEVTRLCTDGSHNACSFLYGAAARAGKALGFKRIQTYILDTESGTSLKASGWTFERMSHPPGWHHDGPRKARHVPEHLKKKKQLWFKQLEKEVPDVNSADLAKAINKKLKYEALTTGIDVKSRVKYVSSGVPMIDYALGGGYPMGRITEIYGHPQTGKSLICMACAAKATRGGINTLWIDQEGAIDYDFLSKINALPENKHFLKWERPKEQPYGEVVYDRIKEFVQVGHAGDYADFDPIGLIIVDSIAALVANPELVESVEKQNMAMNARMNNKGLRAVNALNTNTAVVFINQMRATMDLYGVPEKPTGGQAMGFFASVRIELRKRSVQGKGGSTIQRKFAPTYIPLPDGDPDEIVGTRMAFKITKSKVSAPYKTGDIDFYFNHGIDMAHQRFQVYQESGAITRTGNTYEFKGNKYVGQGALMEHLSTIK